MKILTQEEFKQEKDKKGYIKRYLEYYMIKTLAKFSGMKKVDIEFKVENMIDDIFNLTINKIKTEKIGFTVVIGDMIKYVESKSSSKVFNYYDLFKKSLGIVSDEEKYQRLANKAWAKIAGHLPHTANDYGWGRKCEDQCLAYAINQIGIEVIRASVVGGIPNTIPAYHMSRFEKSFKESYISACNDKSLRVEIAGMISWSEKSQILGAPYLENEDRLLLGMSEVKEEQKTITSGQSSKSNDNLSEFDKRVNNVALSILNDKE